MQTLQRNKISRDHGNIIVFKSSKGNVILDGQIKTHDGWVSGFKVLLEKAEERAQSATAFSKKNINDLHIKLIHPSKSITHATAKAISIQVTSTFKLCENCALGKAEQCGVSIKAIA